MMFSARHYEAVARELAYQREQIDIAHRDVTTEYPRQVRLDQWRDTVTGFERMFASDNPRFDKGRFAKACGIDPLWYDSLAPRRQKESPE